eukprot:gnl/Hemi2/14553_TR4931_c0_g1_i1.p1 gnl/Hemi2/14553_TR4931_c0_g1~~gnl/Hemi2/14553_TR4931_c0_g1_i1.p1  ORF type:complete len:224 (+),score=25.93 gnl/Hemi2/14553_TR4931_c0_g1_i1:73-744(+)
MEPPITLPLSFVDIPPVQVDTSFAFEIAFLDVCKQQEDDQRIKREERAARANAAFEKQKAAALAKQQAADEAMTPKLVAQSHNPVTPAPTSAAATASTNAPTPAPAAYPPILSTPALSSVANTQIPTYQPPAPASTPNVYQQFSLAQLHPAIFSKAVSMGYKPPDINFAVEVFGGNEAKVIEYLNAEFSITSMGFPHDKVRNALLVCDNNHEQAVQYLLSGNL